MRIAVVSPFVDRQHGTERAVAELAERLAHDYGCKVVLYSQRVKDVKLDDSSASGVGPRSGVFWRKVPSVPGPHLLQFIAWLTFNSCARRWDRLSGRRRFDLVLSPGINCLNADVVIVHAVFQRLRELSGESDGNFQAEASFLRKLHRRAYYGFVTMLERRTYTDPNTMLAAVSEHTAELLGKYYRRPDVHVIPNGVDTAQFSRDARLARRREARSRRNFGDDDFVLLLVGNDWRTKGLPVILEAMASCFDLPLKLLVAGSDSSNAFREVAQKMGVLDRCRFESARPDVIDLYAAADTYVSPSREDSFGLPVAEAMTCGLPVITSSCAGISSLIQDGVDGYVLADPKDTESLARAIRTLAESRETRDRIGQNAAQTAQAWTWERNAAAVWELLLKADAKKRQTRR